MTRIERPDHERRRGIGGWFIGAVILACLLFMAFLFRSSPISPLQHDARFVVTTRPTIGFPPNATLTQRVFTWWQRNRPPRPLAYSFGAAPTNRCSIHGLLNQCMEVTAVRYVIAKDVAAGSVMFGHTNALNGIQWVAAFTEALRSGQPEWWDSQAGRFRHENLVLIAKDARTVLVLPRAMAQEFQTRRKD